MYTSETQKGETDIRATNKEATHQTVHTKAIKRPIKNDILHMTANGEYITITVDFYSKSSKLLLSD